MRDAFNKAFRWYFIVMCIAGGTTALMISEETGSMRPVIFGVLGYGFAYVVAALWKEFRGKVMGWGIGVYLAISIGSPYVNDLMYILFGYEGRINPYVLWMSLLTVIGFPVMILVFKRVR